MTRATDVTQAGTDTASKCRLSARGRRVLIADDSPFQTALLASILEADGYAVESEHDGVAALERLRQEQFGVLISDVRMPKMGGYELCSIVKRSAATRQLPVVLVTAMDDPRELIRGLSAGADGYLTKPFDRQALLDRVGALAGRRVEPDLRGGETLDFRGEAYLITAGRQRMLDLLISTYDNAARQSRAADQAREELAAVNHQLAVQRAEVEKLLLTVLPRSAAESLRRSGSCPPRRLEDVTIVFTDFVGFTAIAEQSSAARLVEKLGLYVEELEQIGARHGVERIKNTGDGCLFACGVPEAQPDHASRAVRAALEMQRFVEERAEEQRRRGRTPWRMRVGLHSGPVVAGVLGRRRFAYDVWGDTVNVASRLESGGEAGRVNISAATRERLEAGFRFELRGRLPVKNRGLLEMFFVIDPALRRDPPRGPAASGASGRGSAAPS